MGPPLNYPKKIAPTIPLSKVQKKQVKAIVKERKQLNYFNVSGNEQPLDWTGALFSVSSPAQSLSDIGRVGDTIYCSSLKINYNLSNPSTGVGTARTLEQLVRVIIFRWLPLDSTAPVLGDILNVTLSRQAVFSQYNDDKREQFNILYDKMHNACSRQVTSAQKNFVFDASVKCNKKIEYNAGSTNGTNKIYMLLVSNTDSAAAAGEKVLFDYLTTLRFTN